jgi:hypothetical protein
MTAAASRCRTATTAAQRGYALHVALVSAAGMLCLSLPLDAARPAYPDISDLFPAASRMQRAAIDLLGLHPTGADDQRKWLRHAAWPAGQHPLRKNFDADAVHPTEADAYPFVTVTGDGVHEIPVGPVHAGIIEPGHFRFSIIGDRVLRLEQRLGYTHKGIEKRFESMNLAQGAKLAGRISGDSTVAYAWAYAQAVESLAVPRLRPRWAARGAAELERIHNHLGDLGYLGNDVALAFGFAVLDPQGRCCVNGELSATYRWTRSPAAWPRLDATGEKLRCTLNISKASANRKSRQQRGSGSLLTRGRPSWPRRIDRPARTRGGRAGICAPVPRPMTARADGHTQWRCGRARHPALRGTQRIDPPDPRHLGKHLQGTCELWRCPDDKLLGWVRLARRI